MKADELPRAFGPYVLLERLGTPSASGRAAYLARPRGTERVLPVPLVVKILNRSESRSPGEDLRFRHEAQIATAINHPNVAKVYEMGVVGDALYMAMEHIPGWTLSQIVVLLAERSRPIAPALAVALVDGAIQGLATHARGEGRPHRRAARGRASRCFAEQFDRPPERLDMRHRPRPGPLEPEDLAHARRLGDGHASSSPEQAGGESVDAKSDVYSIAVVLYEVLTLAELHPAGHHLRDARAHDGDETAAALQRSSRHSPRARSSAAARTLHRSRGATGELSRASRRSAQRGARRERKRASRFGARDPPRRGARDSHRAIHARGPQTGLRSRAPLDGRDVRIRRQANVISHRSRPLISGIPAGRGTIVSATAAVAFLHGRGCAVRSAGPGRPLDHARAWASAAPRSVQRAAGAGHRRFRLATAGGGCLADMLSPARPRSLSFRTGCAPSSDARPASSGRSTRARHP